MWAIASDSVDTSIISRYFIVIIVVVALVILAVAVFLGGRNR